MSVPDHLKGRYAYHFTLIDNLESIIVNGLLCTNQKENKNIDHVNVAEKGIQNRRRTMEVPCSIGKHVHDYVPFYFSKKTSMQLGLINKKNIDQPRLIYFAVPLESVDQDGVVFSDASANTDLPPNFYQHSGHLNLLNWEAINEQKWGCPTEQFRHQKMAELLIPDGINICNVSYIVVWNEFIKGEIEKVFASKGLTCPPIKFDNDHYYIDFYDTGNHSIVTGPYFLKSFTLTTIQEICEFTHGKTKYPSINAALVAISQDFNSIKELEEINGLHTNYGFHHEDVGTHSRRVVSNIVGLDEYKNLSLQNQEILQLCAYLHDIGKGPKTRWPQQTMNRADNDHAKKSLAMLKRIFTEDIGKLSNETIIKIVMLVVYDDLVGDIVANGRNEQQLFDIVTCIEDIDMFIALGKADMMSINDFWLLENGQNINDLRARAIASVGNG